MEKLRKIGQWLWLGKERIVLAVLVGVLCYRVYEVANPKTEAELSTASAASGAAPDDSDEPEAGGGPAVPVVPAQPVHPPKRVQNGEIPADLAKDLSPAPYAPIPLAPTSYKSLAKSSPFTAESREESQTESDEPPPPVYLLEVKLWPGDVWKARIQSATKKWYAAGENFEAYRLLSIDPDAKTVEVYSERHGKSFTISLSGAG